MVYIVGQLSYLFVLFSLFVNNPFLHKESFPLIYDNMLLFVTHINDLRPKFDVVENKMPRYDK